MHIIKYILHIYFYEIDEKGMEEPDILTTLNNIKQWWNLAKSMECQKSNYLLLSSELSLTFQFQLLGTTNSVSSASSDSVLKLEKIFCCVNGDSLLSGVLLKLDRCSGDTELVLEGLNALYALSSDNDLSLGKVDITGDEALCAKCKLPSDLDLCSIFL